MMIALLTGGLILLGAGILVAVLRPSPAQWLLGACGVLAVGATVVERRRVATPPAGVAVDMGELADVGGVDARVEW
jgi:hypothetical protein